MEVVKSIVNLEQLNQNIKDDFYIVPNLKFDIEKMRADLNIVLKKKKFNTLGIKNFGAISLNKIHLKLPFLKPLEANKSLSLILLSKKLYKLYSV